MTIDNTFVEKIANYTLSNNRQRLCGTVETEPGKFTRFEVTGPDATALHRAIVEFEDTREGRQL